MTWTLERVDGLVRLWSDGLSARQIADKLGGVTRNAVIGKAHRLNLQRGAPTVEPAPEPPPPRIDYPITPMPEVKNWMCRCGSTNRVVSGSTFAARPSSRGASSAPSI